MSDQIVKKFYKDFSDSELDYLSELLDDICVADVSFPPHVIKRMIARHLLPEKAIHSLNPGYYEDSYRGFQDVIITIDSGEAYEVSNEALGKTTNPFRIVIAKEFDERYTMFVKVAPYPGLEKLKVLDVWMRHGKTPQFYPPHAKDQFDKDWDFVRAFESFFESLSPNHERDSQDDGEDDTGAKVLVRV